MASSSSATASSRNPPTAPGFSNPNLNSTTNNTTEGTNDDGERWFAQIDTFCVGYNHYTGSLNKDDMFELDGKKIQNPNGEQCGWLAKEISPYFYNM